MSKTTFGDEAVPFETKYLKGEEIAMAAVPDVLAMDIYDRDIWVREFIEKRKLPKRDTCCIRMTKWVSGNPTVFVIVNADYRWENIKR